MKTDCGLYVSVTPDGTLKRDLAAISGKVSLTNTTVEDEIIASSELDFGPYAEVVDLIITSSAFIPHEGRIEDTDMNVFQFIQDTTIDLVNTLEWEDPLYGTLTRTTIEDCIPEDDGTGLYVYTTSAQIISILASVMDIQFEVNCSATRFLRISDKINKKNEHNPRKHFRAYCPRKHIKSNRGSPSNGVCFLDPQGGAAFTAPPWFYGSIFSTSSVVNVTPGPITFITMDGRSARFSFLVVSSAFGTASPDLSIWVFQVMHHIVAIRLFQA